MSYASVSFHLLQPRPYPQRLLLVIAMFNEQAVVPFLRSAVAQSEFNVPGNPSRGFNEIYVSRHDQFCMVA